MKISARSGFENKSGNNNRATELGDNPCFECICVPVCREKLWADCVVECGHLMYFFSDNYPYSVWVDIRNLVRSKKIFEMKNLGPA